MVAIDLAISFSSTSKSMVPGCTPVCLLVFVTALNINFTKLLSSSYAIRAAFSGCEGTREPTNFVSIIQSLFASCNNMFLALLLPSEISPASVVIVNAFELLVSEWFELFSLTQLHPWLSAPSSNSSLNEAAPKFR